MPEVNAWVAEGLTPEIAALQEPLGNAVHAAFVEEVAGGQRGRDRVRADRPDEPSACSRWPAPAPYSPRTSTLNGCEMARADGRRSGARRREDVVEPTARGDRRQRRRHRAGDVRLSRRSAPGTRSGHQRRPRVAARARTPCRRRSTSRRRVIFKGIRIYGITGRRSVGHVVPHDRAARGGPRHLPDHHPPPAAGRVRQGIRPRRVRATPARSFCCPRRRRQAMDERPTRPPIARSSGRRPTAQQIDFMRLAAALPRGRDRRAARQEPVPAAAHHERAAGRSHDRRRASP